MGLQNKAALRKILLSKRRSILTAERTSAACTAADLFSKHSFFLNSQHIACYSALLDEFDCMPIIQQIWRENKNCYLPSLLIHEQKLEFILYQSNDVLRLNKYKILESSNTEKINAAGLDVVLVPLVGFDLAGNRLGMGGGYYDRTFAFLREKQQKKPYLIGVGFECQKHKVLPHESWDVLLDAVLTEKMFYRCHHSEDETTSPRNE